MPSYTVYVSWEVSGSYDIAADNKAHARKLALHSWDFSDNEPKGAETVPDTFDINLVELDSK